MKKNKMKTDKQSTIRCYNIKKKEKWGKNKSKRYIKSLKLQHLANRIKFVLLSSKVNSH